jgi:hypothetical protein
MQWNKTVILHREENKASRELRQTVFFKTGE